MYNGRIRCVNNLCWQACYEVSVRQTKTHAWIHLSI